MECRGDSFMKTQVSDRVFLTGFGFSRLDRCGGSSEFFEGLIAVKAYTFDEAEEEGYERGLLDGESLVEEEAEELAQNQQRDSEELERQIEDESRVAQEEAEIASREAEEVQEANKEIEAEIEEQERHERICEYTEYCP